MLVKIVMLKKMDEVACVLKKFKEFLSTAREYISNISKSKR